MAAWRAPGTFIQPIQVVTRPISTAEPLERDQNLNEKLMKVSFEGPHGQRFRIQNMEDTHSCNKTCVYIKCNPKSRRKPKDFDSIWYSTQYPISCWHDGRLCTYGCCETCIRNYIILAPIFFALVHKWICARVKCWQVMQDEQLLPTDEEERLRVRTLGKLNELVKAFIRYIPPQTVIHSFFMPKHGIKINVGKNCENLSTIAEAYEENVSQHTWHAKRNRQKRHLWHLAAASLSFAYLDSKITHT